MSGEEIPAVGSSAARRGLFLSRCVKGATHLSVIVVTFRTAEAASPPCLRWERHYGLTRVTRIDRVVVPAGNLPSGVKSPLLRSIA